MKIMWKYRLDLGFSDVPKPVEVDRSTDSSVWIGGGRRHRYSRFEGYAETWDEARGAIVDYWRTRERSAQAEMDRAREYRRAAERLSKPKS